MRIEKTAHYIERHERDFPFELVKDIIRSTKGIRLGQNLIRFDRRTEKHIIYVLCSIDEKQGVLKVINAKRIKKEGK